MSRQEILEWLEEQDSYYVSHKEFRKAFPDVELVLVGITTKRNDDGETMIPVRDYRQAIKYGQPLD